MPPPDPPEGMKYTKKTHKLSKVGWGGARAKAGRKSTASRYATAAPSTAAATTRNPPPPPLNPSIPPPPSTSVLARQHPNQRGPFFDRRDTRQALPSASAMTGTHGTVTGSGSVAQNASNTGSQPASAPSSSAPRVDPGILSHDEIHRLRENLTFISENDEHGDIASGFDHIDDSLADDSDLMPDANNDGANTGQADREPSDDAPESVVRQYLLTFKERVLKEIEMYHQPLCYQRGQLFEYAIHPVFALKRAGLVEFTPNRLYERDILVWLPAYLPGCPRKFKCTCGKPLSKRGYPDKPIARRVRRTPVDYFLFTNRFWCDSSRTSEPGCGLTLLGTDPIIIAQLPRFVQEFFPGFLSTRGAVDKEMMWQLSSGTVKRFGPSPFSEMVSELQSKYHARRELAYYAAAAHYGRHGKEQIPAFSAFNDPTGFAGSPPSTGYLTAMYTDYINAHRIYMDRAQAALTLGIAKVDHTFDVLKYMGGVKGEKIWKAAYNVVNEFEEVRAESLTLTKSLSFVREMLQNIQKTLRAVGHPPTALLYTDSPQVEQGFHEAITESLSANVRHVSTWTDLPAFERSRSSDVEVDFASDSMVIDSLTADVVKEVSETVAGSTYVVGLAVKFRPGAGDKPRLDIIQLRTKNRIFVFKVTAFNERSHFLPSLKAIFTNNSILKVGFQIRQTLLAIGESLCLSDLITHVRSSQNPAFVDLGCYAKLAGALDDPNASLHTLAGVILQRSFEPPTSDPYPWSLELSNSAVESLYTESDCIWQIWAALSNRQAVGLKLSPDQASTNGQLVTLVLGCKPVAHGFILANHSGYLDVIKDADGNTHRMNISRTRSLIQLTEVLVPLAILTLHRQTVQWIFDHECQTVVTTSQLRSRAATQPAAVHPGSVYGFAIPMPCSSSYDEDDTSFSISYQPPSSEIQIEEWEPTEDDEFLSDSDDDSDFEEDFANWTDEQVMAEAMSHWTALQNHYQTAGTSEEVLPSRILDDALHFMDRLLRLLAKRHSAFKAFSHDFSEAIFIRDKDDEAAVKAVLEKKGISWEFAKRAKSSSLNQRIRRYIPKRQVLLKRLTVLFDGYRDMLCSTKRKHSNRDRFFSEEARQMADRLLDTVRRGFLSDPPGIPLYYLKGKDNDGLNLYRTIRGTSSVEGGVHMAVRRVFGSLKASPELAECLLINWIFRRNQSVGYHNRTGKRFREHFDMWLKDEIVEFTALLDIEPSFRLPRLLATRIATSETFGILPMDTGLAEELGITTLPPIKVEGIPHHRDLPVHTLTRLSTHSMDQYRYLQLRQRTLYPVLPVASLAEFRLFKTLINMPRFKKGNAGYPPHEAFKNIDFKKLAQSWNASVDTQNRTITDSNQRLYYKLPAQLEHHHKKTILWNSERSTLLYGQNAVALKAFTDILASDENTTSVLPALPLDTDDASKTVEELYASINLQSFDPMSLRDGGNVEGGNDDVDMDVESSDPDAMDVEPPSVDAPPLSANEQPTVPQQQSTLHVTQGTIGLAREMPTSANAKGKGKKRDRCAVCLKNYCMRCWDCPGTGNREKCGCPHPRLAKGERVRNITDEMVIARNRAQREEGI